MKNSSKQFSIQIKYFLANQGVQNNNNNNKTKQLGSTNLKWIN